MRTLLGFFFGFLAGATYGIAYFMSHSSLWLWKVFEFLR